MKAETKNSLNMHLIWNHNVKNEMHCDGRWIQWRNVKKIIKKSSICPWSYPFFFCELISWLIFILKLRLKVFVSVNGDVRCHFTIESAVKKDLSWYDTVLFNMNFIFWWKPFVMNPAISLKWMEVLLECMITAKFVGFVKKSVHIAHT